MPPLQETDHSTFGLLSQTNDCSLMRFTNYYYYYNGLMIYYTVPKRLCKQSRHKYRFTLIKLKLLYCPPSQKKNQSHYYYINSYSSTESSKDDWLGVLACLLL